jgi:hypothetical protein
LSTLPQLGTPEIHAPQFDLVIPVAARPTPLLLCGVSL